MQVNYNNKNTGSGGEFTQDHKAPDVESAPSVALDATPTNSTDMTVDKETGDKIDSHIPDGGVMAYLQILGSWTAIIMTFGMSSGTSVLLQWLKKNYLAHDSSSRIGWLFSVQLFIFYFMGIFWGPVVDAYGVRPFIIIGSCGWVTAMFVMSVCKEYYQFVLCYSILGGFSSSLLFNPSVSVLTHWFKKKRGLAIGIAASGSGVGAILFTQIYNKLLDHTSFGWSARAVAFVVLACAIISCLTLRSRHVKKSINWNEIKPDVKALKEPAFVFCVIGLFFAEWAIFVPMQFIVSYAVDRGFTRTFGSNLASYLSTASIVSRICTGFIADYIGSFNMMIVFAFLSGVLCLAVWLPAGGTRGGLVAFVVLFGITTGAVVSLTLITVPRLSTVKDMGRRFGTAYMIASFAVLTGIPISGALTGHHFLGVILFSGIVYLASSVSFFISKCFATKWNALF